MTSETAADVQGLAEVLGQVATQLDTPTGLSEVLELITASSVETVPGADYAGITLVVQGQEVQSVGPTDPLVVEADKAQELLGEGPCLDALRAHATFRIDEYRDEQRWPRYVARALELGIRSSLSFQLFTEARNLGALNLYSRQPFAFGGEAEHTGQLFAGHASIALRGSQREDELQGALRSRDVIGMAKGMLMERHRLDEDRAFQMLVRTSQTSHVKLRDIAELLVRSGATTP